MRSKGIFFSLVNQVNHHSLDQHRKVTEPDVTHSEGGRAETVLPDDGPPDAGSPSVAVDDSTAEAGEQFFKVVNMPAITDNEAMITISTDDGANWVVMSKEERQEEEGKAVKPNRRSSHASADESRYGRCYLSWPISSNLLSW